jgi:hypothetical protein
VRSGRCGTHAEHWRDAEVAHDARRSWPTTSSTSCAGRVCRVQVATRDAQAEPALSQAQRRRTEQWAFGKEFIAICASARPEDQDGKARSSSLEPAGAAAMV